MNPETIKNPNRSRAPGYFLILLGINIAVELRSMVPKQEIKARRGRPTAQAQT